MNKTFGDRLANCDLSFQRMCSIIDVASGDNTVLIQKLSGWKLRNWVVTRVFQAGLIENFWQSFQDPGNRSWLNQLWHILSCNN